MIIFLRERNMIQYLIYIIYSLSKHLYTEVCDGYLKTSLQPIGACAQILRKRVRVFQSNCTQIRVTTNLMWHVALTLAMSFNLNRQDHSEYMHTKKTYTHIYIYIPY